MEDQTSSTSRPISAALRSQVPVIVQRWQDEVRQLVPAAECQPRAELINHLPGYLAALADALEVNDPAQSPRIVETAATDHAETRAQLADYTLDQVLREFHILRRIVVDSLREVAEPTFHEFRVLGTGFDAAVEISASHYVRCNEERLRALQSVTDTALSHLMLDDLLPALLNRVTQVLGADTAAVLLLDGDELYIRAARGLEGAVERGVRVPVGKGFAGRIAASEQPLILDDLGDVTLYNPVLREKGVRSLLGVPLKIGGQVIGVVHVGMLRPRHFTDQDVILLCLAADRFAMGIERARLYDDLRKADQHKSEFVAMVAHELRTPLSAVSNALYILESIRLTDEKAARQLLAANRQTRQLARLVDDLLDISRVSSGKIEVEQEPVDLVKVVENAADSVRPLVEGRGQDFHLSMTLESLTVIGDAGRLEQVVTNLLQNAQKFTEPGGDITLTLQREDAEAVIRVQDTGAGIDPPQLPSIWDMFAQVDPSDARARGGLGIGLSLVRRVVELHGGTVTAHSEGHGLGTEFTIRLPLMALSEAVSSPSGAD